MWVEQSSSSSKSVQRVSSSSTTSPFPPYQIPRTKTMEEVWKEINLSSLQDQPSSRGLMFQDFLARPSDKDPHQNASAATAGFGSGLTVSPPPRHHPATVLTLNSVPEFSLLGDLSHCTQSPLLQLQPRNFSPHSCALDIQFDGMNAAGNPNKRCAGPEIDNNTGDRRHKRMIKNRESAARSRARKQEQPAYTTELELEVDQLTKENARLKEQQRQLCVAVAADRQLRRKQSLHRTSTAPF